MISKSRVALIFKGTEKVSSETRTDFFMWKKGLRFSCEKAAIPATVEVTGNIENKRRKAC